VKSRFVLAALTALAMFVTAVVFVGCPGPTFVVQQYKGPQRTNETIAILRVNGNDPARLLILDDEDVAAPLERDSRLHIEMLPGRHTLVAVNGSNNERSAVIAFQADPGKVYRAAFGPDGAAHVFEVNRSSDVIGADATVPPSVDRVPSRPTPLPRPPSVNEDAGAAAE
jgi:hypothetical protein